MNTPDRDPLVERFRLRIRRDYSHRDEDHARVEQQRGRVRVGLDFARGFSDVHPSEAVADTETCDAI